MWGNTKTVFHTNTKKNVYVVLHFFQCSCAAMESHQSVDAEE